MYLKKWGSPSKRPAISLNCSAFIGNLSSSEGAHAAWVGTKPVPLSIKGDRITREGGGGEGVERDALSNKPIILKVEGWGYW